MKKFYVLLVAVLVAVTANAQVSVRNLGNRENAQLPFKCIQKDNAKGAPAEGWVYYSEYDAAYWGVDELTPGGAYYFGMDSVGLVEYSDGYGRIFMHSAGQTYDFNSDYFDAASAEGDISFLNTSSLNIDSVYIQCMYHRDGNVPAGSKDTIIVGVYTDVDANGYQFTGYPNTCFWGLDCNANTGVQAGAHVYKFPIGDDEVSQPAEEEGYYYFTNLYFPIGLTNVTDKAIHVAYAFKRGYQVGMNDTLPTVMSLYTWKNCDENYFILMDNEARCNNRSHGDYILTFSDGETCDYYYPGFALGSNASTSTSHHPRMAVKFSCSNCEIVNVPEIEKNNMTVYPNPATNHFTVNTGNDEKASIQLFNIVGQQVYSETFTGSTTVNVANLHSGVYMLKVNQNGKVNTTKVVVK